MPSVFAKSPRPHSFSIHPAGKLAIAGALLDKGLSVNVQDSNLATPLITASFKCVG
jgi:ankyrin repeat protein